MNITTIALLWFAQFKRPELPRQPSAQESLIKGVKFLKTQLNLSENQIQLFIESRNKHTEKARQIQDKIFQFKIKILDEVFESSPDSIKIQNLSNEIGIQQTEFEHYLSRHFLELKSYCSPEQQVNLKLTFMDMAAMARFLKPDNPES